MVWNANAVQASATSPTATAEYIAPYPDVAGPSPYNQPVLPSGDLSGVTDRANINAALLSKGVAGGGTVWLAAGIFLVDTTIVFPFSNVQLRGQGMDQTILFAHAGTWPGSGIIACSDSWDQQGNGFSDMTIDLNGYNTTLQTMGVASYYWTYPSSRSVVERVRFVNRNGPRTSGAHIALLGHDQTVKDCLFQDDVQYQQRTVPSTDWSGAGAAGANTITPPSMAGFNIGQPVTIDPPVMAFSEQTIAAGVRIIVPFVVRSNPYANTNGPSTGMLGIVVGQSLVIDTVASGVQETVVVTAVTNNSFTATFINAHTEPFPIIYNPPAATSKTETCLITAVTATTFTITTQTQHVTGPGTPIAIITQPPVYDSVAIGQNPATQNVLTNMGSKVLDCRFERLALDAIGSNSGTDFIIKGNHISQCNAGITLTSSNKSVIVDNDIDLTYGGIYPLTAGQASIFSGYFWVSGATGTTYFDHVFNNNIVRGGCQGFTVFQELTDIILGMVICGNTFDSQQQNAIQHTIAQHSVIAGNVIRNPNRQGLSNANLGSAGILLSAAATGLIDDCNVSDNSITDTSASPTMQYGILLYSLTTNYITRCIFSGNSIIGFQVAGGAIAYAGAAAKQRAYGNIGYNPVGAMSLASTANVSPAMGGTGQPANGTTYTNVSGVDIQLTVSVAGTVTALTINGVQIMSSALVVGQTFLWPAGSTLLCANTGVPTFVASAL